LSLALAVVTGLLGYACLRRWCETGGPAFCPSVCGIVLLLHPAWTVSAIHGDCGSEKLSMSVLATVVAGVFALVQQTAGRRATSEDGLTVRPIHAGDTRFFAGESFHGVRVDAAASRPPDLTPVDLPDAIDRRLVLRAANRFLALVLVGLFAFAQFGWFSRALSGHSEPNWVLGPLYFLVNASSADDWIGYALLTVAVPCLLSVVFRQNRWTALAASLTAWARVIPGTLKALAEW